MNIVDPTTIVYIQKLRFMLRLPGSACYTFSPRTSTLMISTVATAMVTELLVAIQSSSGGIIVILPPLSIEAPAS